MELTIGFESNFLAKTTRKREKYDELINEQLKNYEKAKFEMLKDLEIDKQCRKYLVRKIINTCIRSTYFCKRNKDWDYPQLMSY